MPSGSRTRSRYRWRRWFVLTGGLIVGVLGLWIAREMRTPKRNVVTPVQESACGFDTPASECDSGTTLYPQLNEPWLSTAPVFVRMAYAYAVQHAEDLRWIPCYCGCDRQGHRHVADCFVEPEMAADSPRLRMHAFHCNICLGIVLDVQSLRAKGWSWPAIRNRIDRVYGRLGTGTPTPQPEGWTMDHHNVQ